MEKLRSRLYITVFLFALLSISFALLSNGRQKDFYYIAVYLAILGMILERKRIFFREFNIAYPILLLGLVKIIWFFSFQHEPQGYNFYSDQFNGGKKLILGSILIFYLSRFTFYLEKINFKKIILLILGSGFICASCYAIWQSSQGAGRAEMAINRATISAYIYSTLSIVFIYFLYEKKRILYYLLAALVIVTSFIIIILTGTRAAIIFHLIIIACMTFYHFKKIHFKSVIIILIISAIAIAALYNHYIYPRIMQTYNEVALYQEGQDNTSLGARFSMWNVGLINFSHAPFGQSFKSRFDYSTQYVQEKPQYRATMRFITIHLHDELIETLSLQGIFGGLTLLWFYISIAWVSLKKRNTPLLFTLNCMFVYGLSDVLLLSSEAILFYVSLTGICGIMFTQQKEKI
ncbi:O-antigen ligase family protein [Dryocola sp. BD613]|uniref:O-antigen ligase family protein n=1 Tax=Dryocola sp. BD613 TaxID=3133272 RepID=UPI003F50B947